MTGDVVWLGVWWVTALATTAAVAVFGVHWWRARRRVPLRGVCFYLDEDAVMDLFQVRYEAALEQEIEDRVVREGNVDVTAQVYGVGGGAGRRFSRDVLRRYVRTFRPITVIGTIVDALEAADGVVHVNLRRLRVEPNRALALALGDDEDRRRVRLRDLDAYVSVAARLRQSHVDMDEDEETTVFLAPYGAPEDPEEGPQLQVECVTRWLRGQPPRGNFHARCLGTVPDWDPALGRLTIRPIAIFH